jgi:hypothetical protein
MGAGVGVAAVWPAAGAQAAKATNKTRRSIVLNLC